MSSDKFPILVRNQSVAVKIYRVKAKTTASGFAFTVAWVGPDGRDKATYADLAVAKEEARTKADQLASGINEGTAIGRSDIIELSEARRMAEQFRVPLLSAMAEWVRSREIAGTSVIEACEQWVRSKRLRLNRITVEAAAKAMIKEKDEANKQGSRTYESKLKYGWEAFPNRLIDTISAREWSGFLAKFPDPVTRNDIRKRFVTLARWCVKHRHLPQDQTPEIEKTERAKEGVVPIGIIDPFQFKMVLDLIREKHPHYLAALVLAGFAGVRVEEIHGKRSDPSKRQLWKDILIDRGFMSVSAAKENTPSSRVIHLNDAAIAWLKICTDLKGNGYPSQSGYVCTPNAVTRIRDIAKTSGIDLPENCFRHSWITFRIALTGDKPATATEAGNSVSEIDKRYRVPKPKELGARWFSIFP